jgi:hypothetical protein
MWRWLLVGLGACQNIYLDALMQSSDSCAGLQTLRYTVEQHMPGISQKASGSLAIRFLLFAGRHSNVQSLDDAGRLTAVPMQFPANPLTLASAVDPDDAGVVLPNAVLTHFAPAGVQAASILLLAWRCAVAVLMEQRNSSRI